MAMCVLQLLCEVWWHIAGVTDFVSSPDYTIYYNKLLPSHHFHFERSCANSGSDSLGK
jgi:hypothetical protein